ncbi:hypothetical protein Pint_04591 [Pistacia integerrima]|uniref:Uncharacterized protein n=1 Tax=Pistacia integerrima TaxID=434235 RepID=A0ACC0Z8F3_9ROSI|nr:hypothetical protein Pint_04591 [Pistacia integerrima]
MLSNRCLIIDWFSSFVNQMFVFAWEGNNLWSVRLPSNFGYTVLLADPILDHKYALEGSK